MFRFCLSSQIVRRSGGGVGHHALSLLLDWKSTGSNSIHFLLQSRGGSGFATLACRLQQWPRTRHERRSSGTECPWCRQFLRPAQHFLGLAEAANQQTIGCEHCSAEPSKLSFFCIYALLDWRKARIGVRIFSCHRFGSAPIYSDLEGLCQPGSPNPDRAP